MIRSRQIPEILRSHLNAREMSQRIDEKGVKDDVPENLDTKVDCKYTHKQCPEIEVRESISEE
jgi:hypothetical protein